LQAASLQFEQHINDEDNPDYERWLRQLIAPGTSLGGARPKASVRDETGVLCMAKFPSRRDTRDVGAWELVANSLARKAGINVPEARPLHFQESEFTTFLVKRFDRTAPGRRLAFVSAMTLTQHNPEALTPTPIVNSYFAGSCSTFASTIRTTTCATTASLSADKAFGFRRLTTSIPPSIATNFRLPSTRRRPPATSRLR